MTSPSGLDESALRALEQAGWAAQGEIEPTATPILDALRRGPDPAAALPRLITVLAAAPELGRDALGEVALAEALVAVCGASRALTMTACSRPDALRRAIAEPWNGPAPIEVGENPARDIRLETRSRLLEIAARDLTGRLDMPGVGIALSDVADAAVEAALSKARPEGLRIAVIALGKWGGRELNYASDIDAMVVHDGDDAEAKGVTVALSDLISTTTADGAAFRLDLGLRPEGTAGPPSRTLESYLSYWQRWAEAWEMQALLKARPAAGDPGLGRAFVAAAEAYVYPETLGAEAVTEIRAMKARSEATALGPGVELKRGVGGIRDVEFATQLLQLVHGRADPTIRAQSTLAALEALAEAGYVRDDDATTLMEAYQWLRDVEHRLQLYDLRQTHELPVDPAIRERVAKAMGFRDGPGGTALEEFEAALVGRRAEVRSIHERLFYRPLLEAFADSAAVSIDEVTAARQLSALGFTDAPATRTAIADLTGGLSRRSRLMQQLLPLMLDWLSLSPDPDLGLAQLRLLVTSSVDNAEIVAALRDNPAAAERLCRLLGTSDLLGKLIDRLPAFLPRLGDDGALAEIPGVEETTRALERAVASRPDTQGGIAALHRLRAGRLLWVASHDVIAAPGPDVVAAHLSDLADALAAGALDIAIEATRSEGHAVPPLAVIAMGKWGGRELNYASDLDALIVHSDDGDTEAAGRVVERLLAILGEWSLDIPGASLDLDLRPEGKKGALARSLSSYGTYWERWAEVWEFQALLRARPAAGDATLGAAFLEAARRHVHDRPLSPEDVREIRAMKARVEQERILPGEDPDFHVKLGPGAMADVEWTAQLLQLRHGGGEPELRSPSTVRAVAAAAAAGLVDNADSEALIDAYLFCARARNHLFLRSGRVRDSLPTDPVEAARLGRSLGFDRAPRSSLREEYRRLTRRARRVVERVFYRS